MGGGVGTHGAGLREWVDGPAFGGPEMRGVGMALMVDPLATVAAVVN